MSLESERKGILAGGHLSATPTAKKIHHHGSTGWGDRSDENGDTTNRQRGGPAGKQDDKRKNFKRRTWQVGGERSRK